MPISQPGVFMLFERRVGFGERTQDLRILRSIFQKFLEEVDSFFRLVVDEQSLADRAAGGVFYRQVVLETVIKLDDFAEFLFSLQIVDHLEKKLDGFLLALGGKHDFDQLGADIQAGRVEGQHLFQNWHRFRLKFILFIVSDQRPVFGQRITDQALFFIEFGKLAINLHPRRIQFLHLLVNSNGLEVEARIGIVPGDVFVFGQSIFNPLFPA